jgi:hypothetical protein
VHTGRNPVPTEDQKGEKSGLQKERKNTLRSQCGPEDIADKTRVGRPVGTELKLHDDAGGDADREVEGKNPGPEPGSGFVQGIAGPQVLRLEVDHHHPHADGQKREYVVEGDRQGELET